MSVTLKDVAEAAKVSVSTASRALTGQGPTSVRTRTRLTRIAAELGYRPNPVARNLKSGTSGLVGLVLHNLTNATFQIIADVAQATLRKRGYQLVLCVVGDDPDQEAATLATLRHHRVDGAIVVPTGRNGARLADLTRAGIPVVCAVRRDEGEEFETILADDPEGAYLGTRHLLELGHTRIGLVVGRQQTTSGRERLSGYRRAFQEAGLPVDETLIHEGRYEPETGVSAACAMLDHPDAPTAIFAANHESAPGVFRVIAERGLRVPEDLSLLCYEDMPWFAWHRPTVTVVDNGARDLALLAVERLLARIDARGETTPVREFRVGARLIRRDSCARPASEAR